MLISFPTMKAISSTDPSTAPRAVDPVGSIRSKCLRSLGLCFVAVTFVFAALLLQPWTATAQAVVFKDVGSSHPYRVQIETLAQLGIINGYTDKNGRPDGRFGPNDPVTRQQLAKMVILAMRIPVSEDDKCPFPDVKTSGDLDLYPDNYVAAAAREGIVTGYATPTGPVFKPDAPVIIAHLVTMGTRAAVRPLVVPPKSYRSAWGEFAAPHAEIARVAQYNGLLRELAPPDATLKSMSPTRTATRAEAAALLFNIMGTDPSSLNGRFLGDSTDLVRYFREKTRGNDGKFSVPLEQLAKMYVTYGKRFGIRADMAWAQMLHETGYGQYGGLVFPEQNNMAGIGATGATREDGQPERGNWFATAELGVIAQYAHLAWYIYPQHFSDPYCVKVEPSPEGIITTPGDPRHFSQGGDKPHVGSVRTVYELSGKWAASLEYGGRIQGIVDSVRLTVGLW